MSEASIYRHGFDAGVHDVRTGSMTLICGPGDGPLARGYAAGRRWALANLGPARKKDIQREREAELELEF
jgi:hypothetical protein